MNWMLLLSGIGALALVLDWIFDYCSDESFAGILLATLLLNWIGISEIEKSNERTQIFIMFAFLVYPVIFWSGYRRYLNWKNQNK